jgi:uncharacterized membrane protein
MLERSSSPFHIWYTQEARMYTLMSTLAQVVALHRTGDGAV